jgi:hypothetical protein
MTIYSALNCLEKNGGVAYRFIKKGKEQKCIEIQSSYDRSPNKLCLTHSVFFKNTLNGYKRTLVMRIHKYCIPFFFPKRGWTVSDDDKNIYNKKAEMK